ncbi:MAG: DUF2848 family protein [Candidatus Binataceae bacterium]
MQVVIRKDMMLELVIQPDGTPFKFAPKMVALVSYSGRDRAAVKHHIDELARIGVPPPKSVPEVYTVTTDRFTSGTAIAVLHGETSGEIEFAILIHGAERYIAVASDHTDRRNEKLDVGISKQLVRRVISANVWRLADVAEHWDAILMRSYSFENGERTAYQSGATAALMKPADIIETASRKSRAALENAIVFSGTLPVIGGRLRCGSRFEVELIDPILKRSLSAGYDVIVEDWYRE